MAPVCAARHVPRVLDAEVGVDVAVRVAPRALRVPVAARELQLELRVAPGAHLRDRRLLQRVEAGTSSSRACAAPRTACARITWSAVTVCVGRGVANVIETLPSRVRPDRLHRPARAGRSVPERVRDRLGQLLVAAVDVEPLVRHAEDLRSPCVRLVAEQVDEVERRLVGRLGAVLARCTRRRAAGRCGERCPPGT